MKLVNKNVSKTDIVSVTVLLEDERDKAAYRRIDTVMKCPHCGKPANPTPGDFKVFIPMPLHQSIPGSPIDLGEIHTKCSNCGQEIIDNAQFDLSAFSEVTQFLGQLRAVAAAKRAGVQRRGKA